jgi:hypothetical protein
MPTPVCSGRGWHADRLRRERLYADPEAKGDRVLATSSFMIVFRFLHIVAGVLWVGSAFLFVGSSGRLRQRSGRRPAR